MRRSLLLLSIVVVLATLARAWVRPIEIGVPDESRPRPLLGLAAPFGDDLKGSSDAFLSLQARSLVREGFWATGCIPLFNVEKAPPGDFYYYDHHPPGVAIATALAFRIFGESEAVARSVALLFATFTLVVVAACVRRALGDGAAAVAMTAMAALPIGLYWATHLDYFVPTIAACAAFLALALRDAPTRRSIRLAAVALGLAMCLDSLAILAPAAFSLERLLFGPRRWREILGWPAMAVVFAVGWSRWTHWQLGRHGHDDGVDRLAYLLVTLLPPGVTTIDLLRTFEHHLRALVTPFGEAVLLAGVALALRPGARGELDRFLRASTLLALGVGLLPRLHVTAGHVYFQLYWILPLGASAALIAARGAKWFAGRDDTASPSKRIAVQSLLAALFLFAGWAALPEVAPIPDRPTSARLGAEFARQPPTAHAIALPATSTFNEFVPDWYARRVVLRLPLGPETRAALQPKLTLLGLDDPAPAAVLLAKDPDWPGRAGFVPLPK